MVPIGRHRRAFVAGWLSGALSGGAFGLGAAALIIAVRVLGVPGAWDRALLLPAEGVPPAAARAGRLPDAPRLPEPPAMSTQRRTPSGQGTPGHPVGELALEPECAVTPAGVPTLFLSLQAERLAVFEGEPLRCGRLREHLGIPVPPLSGPAAVELTRGVPFLGESELWQVLEGLQAESWHAGEELALQAPNSTPRVDE